MTNPTFLYYTIILILEHCALQFWLESSNLEIFSFDITDKQQINIFFGQPFFILFESVHIKFLEKNNVDMGISAKKHNFF